MNLYKLLIYIFFVFIEYKFVVVADNYNETSPNREFQCYYKDCPFTNIINSIDAIKSYINNETNVLKDSINSVTNGIVNEIKIIKNKLNNNETLKLEKKIEKISDWITSLNETNIIKDKLNKNETLKLTMTIKELSDSINYVRSNIFNELNTIKDQLNKNDLSKLQKEIEKLSDWIIAVNQTNILEYKFNKNEASKLTKKTEELLEKLFICLLVIAIILIIVLLAEVRFKIITKIIQRWSGTSRVNENCYDLSESSNNPLLDSRKSDSLKYELQNIKGEMNRIESVILKTNSYALSELNNKIEKFYSDLDIQFQNFVKEANETIAKMKNDFNESESKVNQK